MEHNIIPLQTAAQINGPQTGQVELPAPPLTADELRSKLVEQFEAFKPALQQYQDYAQRCSALALEYHAARFAEALPGTPVEELTLIGTLDARETPKSLDKALAQLQGVTVQRITFDRTKSTYYLFA